MASKQKTRTTLSDAELADLFDLVQEADTMELKLTVPDSNFRSAALALGMDPLDAQIRMVYFFDTPDLKLFENGLVVRARRVQNKGDDTVVKLRPVVPSQLSPELRALEGFGVEVDAMPGGYVCSASFKGQPAKATVKDTVASGGPLRKLFSKGQRALFAEHAPEGIGLDDLSILGPILVLKLKFSPKGYDRKLVAELWNYPDSTRVLELSTKCLPGEAFQVAAQTRAFLTKADVDLAGEQAPKTRKALEFFSAALQGTA